MHRHCKSTIFNLHTVLTARLQEQMTTNCYKLKMKATPNLQSEEEQEKRGKRIHTYTVEDLSLIAHFVFMAWLQKQTIKPAQSQ